MAKSTRFRTIISNNIHIFAERKRSIMFIGRKKELAELRDTLNAESSKFVAVYGRRRVGKTLLIKEAFGKKISFHYAGVYNVSKRKQLLNFCLALKNAGMADFPIPENWFSAFDLLGSYLGSIQTEKKVVFLDEVPWMDTPKSDFLPALEHFWNNWAALRNDIILIICGSATSWIVKKVFKNKGGLHNRLSFKINLKPFTLKECEEYSKAVGLVMTRFQILEAYMILGGVPYYWSFLNKGVSLAKNIDNMFFTEDAKLDGEFSELYAALFKNPDPYVAVVEQLAGKAYGMSRDDLLEKLSLSDGGKLSTILEDLVNCGFIRKYNKIGSKTKNAIYQLIDCYTIFYYKFLNGKAGNDPAFWELSQGTPAYNVWAGVAFERVCLLHINQIKSGLSILGVITNICSWRSSIISKEDKRNIKGAQIDLLLDRNDKIINLCEMKFSSNEYQITKAYDENLRNKKARFIEETNTRKAVHITMVTTYGVKHNEYFNNIQSQVTLDELFA